MVKFSEWIQIRCYLLYCSLNLCCVGVWHLDCRYNNTQISWLTHVTNFYAGFLREKVVQVIFFIVYIGVFWITKTRPFATLGIMKEPSACFISWTGWCLWRLGHLASLNCLLWHAVPCASIHNIEVVWVSPALHACKFSKLLAGSSSKPNSYKTNKVKVPTWQAKNQHHCKYSCTSWEGCQSVYFSTHFQCFCLVRVFVAIFLLVC